MAYCVKMHDVLHKCVCPKHLYHDRKRPTHWLWPWVMPLHSVQALSWRCKTDWAPANFFHHDWSMDIGFDGLPCPGRFLDLGHQQVGQRLSNICLARHERHFAAVKHPQSSHRHFALVLWFSRARRISELVYSPKCGTAPLTKRSLCPNPAGKNISGLTQDQIRKAEALHKELSFMVSSYSKDPVRIQLTNCCCALSN